MEYKYDLESDVLSITISNKPFDYAKENGDFIVHFDKSDKPVYIEILHAHNFFKHATTSLPKSIQKDIFSRS